MNICEKLLQCKKLFSIYRYNILYCKVSFIPVMQCCIFIIITPVFSVTWSSEIIIIYWFTAQETFLIIINVDNSRAALCFCGNSDALFFRILWWIKSSKEQHLLHIDICYDIINILLSFVTNLMHPCWIKVLMSFKKKSYWPQTFERGVYVSCTTFQIFLCVQKTNIYTISHFISCIKSHCHSDAKKSIK